MKRTHLTTLSIAFILCALLCRVKAQPNQVSNYGFEAGTTVSGWTTTNHAGTSSITTTNMRSGIRAYANATTTRTTTGYVQNNTAIAVPNGKYLVLIGYYRVSANQSSARVELGISGNMGTAVTPAANNTTYQITRVIQNTTGSTQNWNARINMYVTNITSTNRTFTWDDIIAYVSDNNSVDATAPNAATNVSASYSSNSATLSWTNGTDNEILQRSVIMRRTSQCAAEQTLAAQTIYSAAGGYGQSTEGSWTILDTVSASVTTYTDNTITNGTYYTYQVIHEDKAYNHSDPERTYVPVSATTTPTSPASNATNISYTPSLTLSWPAACGASLYDVYFSATQTDVDNMVSSVLVSSSQTGTTYSPSIVFNANTNYYWKVVPKNSNGNPAPSCPTWRFTTNTPSLSYAITRATNTTDFSSINASGENFSWSGTYNADDMMSDALDLTAIGFTAFRFQDRVISSLKVNTNGFVTFNMSSGASYTNDFAGTTQIVAPFWEDLVCQGYMGTSQAQATQQELLKNSIKYLITGAQGSQVLTIEWSEMEIYSNAGPSLNFQLKLYEADDRIDFVFGRMYGFNGTINYTYTYSSGISGATVSDPPTAGQLICQQISNVLNFSSTNATSIAELPDCNSTISLTPNASPAATNESARSITNNECAVATVLPIQYGVQNDFCKVYSTKGATASSSIPTCSATTPGTADDDVWFKFTTTTAGDYGITVNGSGSFNPVVQLFSGNCNTLTAVNCANATGNGMIETITASNLAEATYFVRVYDANTGSGGSGNFVISVYNIVTPPSNDNCSGATELTLGTQLNSGNTANATASASVPVCTATTPGTPDDDVWFKFTATSTITRISTNGGSSYNVVLQYFSGSCASLTSVGCVSNTGASGIEYADVTTTIGSTYYIRVYHSASGATPTTGFSILVENGIPLCPALSAPTNGTNTVNRTQTRSLTWTAVTSPSVGTKTYTVQVATDPNFTSLVTLSNSTGITGTTYTIAANTLAAGTLYYWRVLCVNSNGSSSGCGYYTMATTGTAPSCALGLTPADGSTNQATSTSLSWTAGSGTPTSYDVYLSTSQSLVTSLNASARVATSQTGTTYNATGLTNAATYYWTAIPKNGSGNASGCFVSSFIVIPEAPSNNDCGGATSISATSSAAVTGTVLNASQSMTATVGSAEDDVWYKFVAASTAHNISVEPSSSFNAVVELFSGACGSLTSLSCKNANGTGVMENLSATGLTVGQTYYVRVYDFAATVPSTTTFSIRINDIDLGISSFISPSANTCGNTTVTVALRNYSVAPINFADNPVTISSSAVSPGNVTTTFDDVVVNTGTLASGATQQVTVTTTYNVINSGTYTYTATATNSNDNNQTNNSLTSGLQTITLPSPYIVSGSGTYCAGGATLTLSGSETGTNYQLYYGSTAVSDVKPGTGSALAFSYVTQSGSYRVVATSTTTGCASYMSASVSATVTPLWLGVNTNWNDPANWCGNVVPATNANIVISGSATNMPALPGNVSVNNLELDANKRIDLNGGTLTINGAISGTGTIRGSATSAVVINGSGDMGSLRMDQTTTGTTNRLQNLTVNVGTSKTGNTVATGNRVEVTGTVTINNGTLSAGGNLVLVSNSSGTARIAAIGSTADITGNVISQRYIPAVVRRSRMLSPNTSNFTFADLKDDIFVTGAGGSTNGFDDNTQSVTVYTYQESTTGGRGWKGATSINQAIEAGKGTTVFVRGDRTLPSPQWYTAPYVSQNEVTIDFTGPVNKGDISPALTYTNTGDATSDGWNLVGNPYPSQISWSAVTKSNLNSFIYVLDPATNGYVANDGTTPIASGQAFFVQANAASPSITFTESCKTAASGTSLFKTNPLPRFTIKMVKDSLNSDVAWLKFVTGASMSYNPMEDALKFTNATINMGFNVPSNADVQLNTVPELTANIADTFQLFTNAANATYTLQFTQFGGIPASKAVLLRDLFTNTITNLRTDSIVTFSITSAAASKGQRFQLIIIDAGALPVSFVSVSAQVTDKKDVEIKWTTASEKNNKGFVIERASEKGNWEEAGFVKGHGNSNAFISYNFTDLTPFKKSNTLYYRVKQVDFSGAVQYSKAVKVDLKVEETTAHSDILVYPNPATGSVVVEWEQPDALGLITITDITGKTVKEINETSNKALINITELNTGIYFIRTADAKTQKLVVN